MSEAELKSCPFCGGNVEFEASFAIYNRLWQGKCINCGMMFAYQEEHEPLTNDFTVLGMKEVYYHRMVAKNKPFEEVWNGRVEDEQRTTD